jgi:ABC-type multidrug transport system ATPase subunit
MIRIDHVTKRFGRTPAIQDACLELRSGESVALWGANGAGKTTLIRCVLGLLRFQGVISVGGFDVRHQGKRARMLIGYVPQELGFYDDLGVAEAIAFFATLKRAEVRSVPEALAGVGLDGHGRKRIRELSGGMKQRLALAIALLGDPAVLVLDEVTASLDACGRAELVSLLTRLAGSGRTMLFASHRVEEVATLASRVVVLNRGCVASDTPVRAFLAGLGAGMVLHLVMPEGVRARAMSSLRDGGFNPSLNGIGLLVPVPPEQKAAPFRVLADARISVDDFEIISHADLASAAHPAKEHIP